MGILHLTVFCFIDVSYHEESAGRRGKEGKKEKKEKKKRKKEGKKKGRGEEEEGMLRHRNLLPRLAGGEVKEKKEGKSKKNGKLYG